MKEQELKGKFVIGYDTICDGNQCNMVEDEQGNSSPRLFDSEADAMLELFDDALAMLENKTDDELEECEIPRQRISQMQLVSASCDVAKMKEFLEQHPECNYNDEFIEAADEFVMNRKTFFGNQGIIIAGTKLINL